MSGIWQLVFIAAAISLAKCLHKLPWLRRVQLPDALTAGVLLALFYNQVHLPKDWLKPLVGHLLNIFYIALTLKSSSSMPKSIRGPSCKSGDTRGTVLFILWHYGTQAFIGLGLAMFLVYFFYPELPAAIGLFVPLGYALGPAQAYEIGSQWQDAKGQGLGDIGLTLGALGYLWASLGGMLVLNLFHRGRPFSSAPLATENKRGKPNRYRAIPQQGIDRYSSALAEIFLCYGLGLLFIEALEQVLLLLKDHINLLALMPTFRSISFVFCMLAALCFQWGLRQLNAYKLYRGKKNVVQQMQIAARERHESLNHFSNIFINVMVCAGVGSISFALLWQYLGVIAVLAILGFVLLTPLHFLGARYFFREERLERALVIYGGMMGTTSTGMALLGTLDPYFESAAARDYLLATGFAFLGLLPVIASLYWIQNGQNWWALGLYASYVLCTSTLIIWRIRQNQRPSRKHDKNRGICSSIHV